MKCQRICKHIAKATQPALPLVEPTLYQSFVKELAKPAHVTAFQDGFRIAHAQKNKINLCFVDRLVQIDNDKKIKTK
jgi:hypothetical protein